MGLIPYKYWNELRTYTTSNSQFPSAAPLTKVVPALRTDSDVYLRSIWSATVRYFSPGTATTYPWWATAYVRLVISWDPENQQDPSDVGVDDPLTLGFVDLQPRYTKLLPTDEYLIQWDLPENNIVLTTSRDGDGVGVKPQLLANLYYGDQNGFLSGTAESASLRRAQITGRVLWGSTAAS